MVSNVTGISLNGTSSLVQRQWVVNPTFTHILIAMAVTIIILGLVSNILLIASIFKMPKLHTAANAIVLFMCFLDICRIVHIMSFDLVTGLTGKWQFNKTSVCVYTAFMTNFMGIATGFSLCVISINRMMMITRHDIYYNVFNRRNTTVILTCNIVLSLIISLPVVLKGLNIYALFSGQTGSCYAFDSNANKPFQTASLFFAFILPSVIMVPAYSWICYFVRRSKRRVAAHGNHLGHVSVTFREELRSALIIFLTYITYCLMYIPLYASYILYMFGVNVPTAVLVSSSYLMDFHRFIRPSLYPILGQSYRQALFKLFQKIQISPPISTATNETGTKVSAEGIVVRAPQRGNNHPRQ